MTHGQCYSQSKPQPQRLRFGRLTTHVHLRLQNHFNPHHLPTFPNPCPFGPLLPQLTYYLLAPTAEDVYLAWQLGWAKAELHAATTLPTTTKTKSKWAFCHCSSRADLAPFSPPHCKGQFWSCFFEGRERKAQPQPGPAAAVLGLLAGCRVTGDGEETVG